MLSKSNQNNKMRNTLEVSKHDFNNFAGFVLVDAALRLLYSSNEN